MRRPWGLLPLRRAARGFPAAPSPPQHPGSAPPRPRPRPVPAPCPPRPSTSYHTLQYGRRCRSYPFRRHPLARLRRRAVRRTPRTASFVPRRRAGPPGRAAPAPRSGAGPPRSAARPAPTRRTARPPLRQPQHTRRSDSRRTPARLEFFVSRTRLRQVSTARPPRLGALRGASASAASAATGHGP